VPAPPPDPTVPAVPALPPGELEHPAPAASDTARALVTASAILPTTTIRAMPERYRLRPNPARRYAGAASA
jgi:hypothetical protein